MFSVENIQILRNSLAEFVALDKPESCIDYETTLQNDEKVKIRSRQAHANHLKTEKEYNEVADLVLIQFYFDICIVIIRWDNENKKWIRLINCDNIDKPIVYLVYTGTIGENDAHYDALIPLEAGR